MLLRGDAMMGYANATARAKTCFARIVGYRVIYLDCWSDSRMLECTDKLEVRAAARIGCRKGTLIPAYVCGVQAVQHAVETDRI